MSQLHPENRIGDPDTFYAELIELHRGLNDEQARLVDARLILLLANEVGDLGVLRQAMAAARQGI
ncbi:MAG TPA: DUF2783 domain-containing protein [Stellaceae bacterium]|nr:DUF2783 domain-containing protein [Stellaceae bacterium]